MRVLWLCSYPPYPPDFGGARRTYNLIEQAANAGHTVDLLAFASGDAGRDAQAETELRRICAHVELVHDPWALPAALGNGDPTAVHRKRRAQLRALCSPRPYQYHAHYSARMQEALDARAATGHYDLVQVEFSQMAYYRLPPGVPALIDLHNIESEVLGRVARASEHAPLRRLYNWSEYLKFRRDEPRLWRRFAGVLVTSERDGRQVQADWPDAPVVVVPNGVDTDYFHPPVAGAGPAADAGPQVVFTGMMAYYPNHDAACYFADAVWPRVRETSPAAHWLVVGAEPPPAVRALDDPGRGIIVTGRVRRRAALRLAQPRQRGAAAHGRGHAAEDRGGAGHGAAARLDRARLRGPGRRAGRASADGRHAGRLRRRGHAADRRAGARGLARARRAQPGGRPLQLARGGPAHAGYLGAPRRREGRHMNPAPTTTPHMPAARRSRRMARLLRLGAFAAAGVLLALAGLWLPWSLPGPAGPIRLDAPRAWAELVITGTVTWKNSTQTVAGVGVVLKDRVKGTVVMRAQTDARGVYMLGPGVGDWLVEIPSTDRYWGYAQAVIVFPHDAHTLDFQITTRPPEPPTPTAGPATPTPVGGPGGEGGPASGAPGPGILPPGGGSAAGTTPGPHGGAGSPLPPSGTGAIPGTTLSLALGGLALLLAGLWLRGAAGAARGRL